MSELNATPQSGNTTTVIINDQRSKGNAVGIAGFVLALVALVFSWVPVLNWILWIVGLILSAIGVFKVPRGLAIAGLVISLVSVIIIIAVVASFAAAVAGIDSALSR